MLPWAGKPAKVTLSRLPQLKREETKQLPDPEEPTVKPVFFQVSVEEKKWKKQVQVASLNFSLFTKHKFPD